MSEVIQLKYLIFGVAAVTILFIAFSMVFLRAIYWGRYPYARKKRWRKNRKGN